VRWIGKARQSVDGLVGPFWLGFLGGIVSVGGLAVAFLLMAVSISPANPTQQLFHDLTEVGAAFFIAYSIAIAGAGSRARDPLEHLNWLGVSCGLGISGLLAIAMTVALAAYREAGHADALSTVGLCWTLASLTLMGILIALLPLAVYQWQRSD
jgi:hypothetical protein